MQEVNHQLFTESVLDEVLISMEEENQERAEEILNRLDLLAFKAVSYTHLGDGADAGGLSSLGDRKIQGRHGL